MVLIVVAEKVAREEGPDMVLFLTAGMVVIIVLSFVWRIGTKVE